MDSGQTYSNTHHLMAHKIDQFLVIIFIRIINALSVELKLDK